jgi:phospholipid/cholesterol/gamma-HCH transport system substrate-binding protein
VSDLRTRIRVTARRILFRNRITFVAMLGLTCLAAATALYILDQQRVRFPYLDDEPFILRAEFSTAQAVLPGQGQTVRVSGVRIGDIASARLREGRALITMEVDPRYAPLIHRDATALLRPKTGLKDMFVELDPGRRGEPVEDGFTIPLRSTLPDVNTDEVLAMLDADTRDRLKLLVHGAGGGLKRRGGDLGEAFRRLEPTHKDLARVSGAVARRERNLRRLVGSLRRLNERLAGSEDDLARLVSESARVFEAFASEERNISRSVSRFPEALDETATTLGKVDRLARVLRPAAERLRPALRALDAANEEVTPAAREGAPILRSEVRPFLRAARPLARDLRPAAPRLAESAPRLERTFRVVNHLFNMLGFNPNGREPAGKPDREEGYLFWAAWVGHQGVNLFSNADAHGPLRPVALSAACNTFNSIVKQAPENEFLLNLTPILTDSQACGGEGLAPLRKAGRLAPLRERNRKGRGR